MKSIKNLVAVLALTVVASGAFAGTRTEGDVRVNYEDLNIQKRAGAEVLYRRLESAARHACGASNVRQPIGVRAERERCVEDKLETAVRSVGSDLLSRIHNS